jgi:hypothetical protein
LMRIIQDPISVTLETHFQNTFTCLECHTKAAIAPAAATQILASDYSFLFGMADSSSSRDRDLKKANGVRPTGRQPTAGARPAVTMTRQLGCRFGRNTERTEC